MTDFSSLRPESTEPVLEQLFDDDGPIWRCSGCGMTSLHRQQWQAEVHWYALCRSSGQVGRSCVKLDTACWPGIPSQLKDTQCHLSSPK